MLRRSLAVKVDVLDPQKQLDLVEQTKPRLLEDTVWYLEDARELVKSVVAYPRPRSAGGPDGLFRLVLRRIRALSETLAGALHASEGKASVARSGSSDPFLIARARSATVLSNRFAAVRYLVTRSIPTALRWLPGQGDVRRIRPNRLLEAGEIPPEVNRYFVECYRRFVNLKCVLEAREHTAQVTSEDREEREERFRSGDLPLLFCSPTMELGVDIAQLNLVNLRNVPPTPANYAQRSGRAAAAANRR